MPTPELEIELAAQPSVSWREARDRSGAGPHLGDGWISYRRGLGLRPEFVQVRDTDGAVESIGIAWLSRPRFRPWVRPAAQLDRLPVPVDGSDDDPAHATARARALAELARARWCALDVDSFGGPSPPPDLAAAGFDVRERFEFTVDLRPDDDERWSKIKPSHRRKIRKAERAGVSVDLRADAAAELAALQEFTSDRRASRGEDMQSLDEERYRALIAALQADADSVLVAVATHAGETVSAMLNALRGRHAYYLLGGTNAAGLEHNAASLVFWEAMRSLRARGVEHLNLGGVPAGAADPGSPAHGLFRFKSGWGAAAASCRSGSWRP